MNSSSSNRLNPNITRNIYQLPPFYHKREKSCHETCLSILPKKYHENSSFLMLLGEIERDQSYKMGEAHGTKGELKEVMIIFTLSSITVV